MLTPLRPPAWFRASWVADGIALQESLALGRIQEITVVDSSLAQDIVALPWIADDINDNELVALAQLRDITAHDPSLAANLVNAPWVSDGMTPTEHLALVVVRGIAQEDVSLAHSIVNAAAPAGGIDDDDLTELTGSSNYFLERIERDHPAIGETVRGYRWLDGSTGWDRRETLSGLLARPILDRAASYREWVVLISLEEIASANPELAERVASLAWLADDITEFEAVAINRISDIVRADPLFPERIVDLPWFVDGITEHELRAISNVTTAVHGAPRIGELIVDQPWFQDDRGCRRGGPPHCPLYRLLRGRYLRAGHCRPPRAVRDSLPAIG